MLHLILGSVHSGKSRYLQSVVADMLQCKKEIFYIVPEQLSYETEKSFLDEFGIADANRIHVLSFTKLCETITAITGGQQAPVVDDSLKSVCMMSALQNLAGNLRYYKRGTQTLNFANSMRTVIDELKQNDISPKALHQAISMLNSSNLSDKLYDIHLIFETYNAILQNRFTDPNDRLRFCAEQLVSRPIFKDSIFIFDAFDGYMANQHLLLNTIMVQASAVYISLPCDGGIYTENDLSVFANIRAEARKLIAAAKRNGVAVAEPVVLTQTDYAYQDLQHLEQVLSERSEATFSDPAEHISLVQAPHIFDALDYIAFEIKRLVVRENYRFRDFAIVARDCTNYSGALENIAEKYNLPIFFDQRHSLVHTPLFRLLVSVLSAADNIQSETIFNLLKTGLLPFSDAEISALENYCYIWDIDRLAWYEIWTKNPTGLEKTDARTIEKLDNLNQLRERVVSIIAPLRDNRGDTLSDITKALYRFMIANRIPEALQKFCAELKSASAFDKAQNQISAYEKMISVFNKLIQCDDGRKISAEAYLDLLFACADGESIGTVPHHLDTVMFCSSERARVTNAKAVFMLGVNQGELPRLGAPAGLLSSRERQMMISAGIDIKDNLITQAIDEKFKFYACACAATERVYFCYSLSDFAMQSQEPSYIISQTESVFPVCNRIEYSVAQNTEFADMFDRKPAFEKSIFLQSEAQKERETAKAFFADDPLFSKQLFAVSRQDSQAFSLSPKTAKALYGARLNLSSTQIETFHKCPFAYFCRYGIAAKPIQKADIDALRRGTLVHYYLEKFIQRHSQDYAALDDTEISEEIEHIAADYLQETGLQESDLNEQLKYIFIDLKNQMFLMIRDIVAELCNSQFEPMACELQIGKGAEVPPLEISFSGGVISVSGIVDRVDVAQIDTESYIRIVDYKTNSKKFRINDILYGLNMQMLIYLYAIVKHHPYKIGGILYKPAKVSLTEVTSSNHKEPPVIQSNGLLLRDAQVIQAMDSTGRYINAEIKNDKVSEKGTATAREFENIFSTIETVLAKMGDALHSGLAYARPLKEDTLPCTYCQYKPVCLTENENNCRYTESRSDKEALAELEGRMRDGL
ncbi:MAG: PD-(D/E)XK nuclease family protein [Clostridia bacterium]|nr:PD-(D/E)XK nuclease family protein [Clostridia bacterium]